MSLFASMFLSLVNKTAVHICFYVPNLVNKTALHILFTELSYFLFIALPCVQSALKNFIH